MSKKIKTVEKPRKHHTVSLGIATLLGVGVGYGLHALMKLGEISANEPIEIEDEIITKPQSKPQTNWTPSVQQRAPRGVQPTEFHGNAPRKHKNIV